MGFHVVRPGLHSLIVDHGRPHDRHRGIPLGGAADRMLFQLGNAILGNDLNAPALEITQLGPTLLADRVMACVVMGEAFPATIRGKTRILLGIGFQLQPGDELQIGATSRQLRGYLCVAGGFQVEEQLGSCSAWKPIQTGDRLNAASSLSRRLGIQYSSISVESVTTIRVVRGTQYDWFDREGFTHQSYTVEPTSNRMGIRLKGVSIKRLDREMVSEPVAPGAIQITNEGQPIILGIDCQTIGGYPKIAHVIAADLDTLAQLRPYEGVSFQWVDGSVADRAWSQRERELQMWRNYLKWAIG